MKVQESFYVIEGQKFQYPEKVHLHINLCFRSLF